MDARLQKIKERKLRKLKEQGLVSNDEEPVNKERPVVEPEETEQKDETTSSATKDENEMVIGDMVERIRNENTRSDNPNKWEKSKIDLTKFEKPKPKGPSYNPQDERNPEFAPPSFYTTTEPKTSQKRKRDTAKDREDQTTAERTEYQIPDSSETEIPSSYSDTYTQNTPMSTYTPQGYVDPNWSPQVPNSTHYNYPSTLQGGIPPNLPPPPTHAFLPPPYNFSTPPYNLPTPQYNMPPPPHMLPHPGGVIPPNLPPPPIHAFPPPPFPHN